MSGEQILTGVASAPGIAIGELFLYLRDEPDIKRYCVIESQREQEISRLEEAIAKSRRQLIGLCDHLRNLIGETSARIFEAQAVILQDVEMIGEIRTIIMREGLNAESVVKDGTERWYEKMFSLEGELFRQRAQDIRDVGRRLIKNLLGSGEGMIGPIEHPAVLVADDLMPSDVIHMVQGKVLGVATDLGGATSHTAILTRSLEVPAVVGLKRLTRLVRNGDRIIVNGNSGKVIINPDPETIETYQVKRFHYEAYRTDLANIRLLPAVTLDGRRIHLRANIELLQEVDAIGLHGGEGIGLFRSEYMFLARDVLPSEEEQYADYVEVIKAMAPHPVTIRTFDLGGDKVFIDPPQQDDQVRVEANPFMGWRALRISLDKPELFHTQLRAILRAATTGPTRIMFPLVTDVAEMRQVKGHLAYVKDQLKSEGIEHNPNVAVGVMIELPSAVLMADHLAREVDFFSIGTNDLTQFTLAVDRGNERVRERYQPLHPAVIQLIKMAVDAGHRAGIEVGMCGELAADPMATMLLVGLGLDELSVSPVALTEIKRIIRSIKYSDAVALAQEAVTIDNADQLRQFCRDRMKACFSDWQIWFNGNGQL